ncbi:MAG: flavodoxin domain-containing protein [Cellulosilyticaceae bacterium]
MKTLIVYSSKYGATKQCAEQLAGKLKGDTTLVNLSEQSTIDPKPYDQIVMGSSIYAGCMRKEIKAFCTEYEAVLVQKKLYLFLSCFDEQGKTRYVEANLAEGIQKALRETVCCGGAFNLQKMNFFEKFVVKMIAKSQKDTENSLPQIDGKHNVDRISEEKIDALAKLLK